MAEKPDFVASFQRPQNTEIKHIRNNWYLYPELPSEIDTQSL